MSNQDRMLRIVLGFLALFGLAHIQSSAHAYSNYELAFKSWVERYVPGQKPEFVRPYLVNKSATIYVDSASAGINGNRERPRSADPTRNHVTVNRAEARSRIPRSLSASHPGRTKRSL